MNDAGEKFVLITGGSRGIGRAISLKFSENNWNVLINYKENSIEAEKTLKEMKKGGKADLYKADITILKEAENMIEKIVEQYGKIDVLVNNAGIIKDNLILKQTEVEWDEVISVNLKGVFNVTRSAVKCMLKNRNGHIINISSLSGIRGSFGQSAYSSAKGGLIGFSKTLARELGPRNIKVNVILPGFVLTDMGNKIGGEKIKEKIQENCLGRINEPEDIANFVYFLAQTENISGQVFNIDSRIY